MTTLEEADASSAVANASTDRAAGSVCVKMPSTFSEPSARASSTAPNAQSYTFFVVKTPSYLHRSGRLGKTALALGSALKLKPLFMLRDGSIEQAGIVRTVPRSIPCIFASFDAEGLHVRDLEVAELNPGLAAHTGPGTLAVSVMPTRVPVVE